MTQREFDLGDAELEVLKVLWQRQPATVRDVLAVLQVEGRNLAYTTVQTVLTRLEQKGFVESDRGGPAFTYRALATRAHVSQSRLQALLDQLFDGAPGALALHLVKNEKLSRSEIEELHQLIERLDRSKSGRKPDGDERR